MAFRFAILFVRHPGLEVAEVRVGRHLSIGNKFARVAAAIQAVTAGKAHKEPRKPVGVGIADQEQAFVAQFVEEICKARRHRLFVKLPDEFQRLLVDQRTVWNPRDLAEQMKDHPVGRPGVIARDVRERRVRRLCEDVIGG